MIVYGIRNCNTVKAALQWLVERNIDFVFHDYKSKGISDEKLRAWCEQVGWERILNKRGTTWRKLDADEQKKVTGAGAAIDLMKEKTSAIKRPLIESEGRVVALGFDPEEYRKIFS